MTRSELRASEYEWRHTTHVLPPYYIGTEKKKVNVVPAIALIFLAVLSLVLWDSQKTCEERAGKHSAYCVD